MRFLSLSSRAGSLDSLSSLSLYACREGVLEA